MENVKLIEFDISKVEIELINRIISKYLEKIEKFIKIKELQLRLKQSKHGKNFLHEVKGKLITDKKMFNASITDYNLFYAVDKVLEKLLNEIKHYVRKE